MKMLRNGMCRYKAILSYRPRLLGAINQGCRGWEYLHGSHVPIVLAV